MRTEVLSYLCCPECDADLKLAVETRRDGDHVMEGELVCVKGACRYPVTAGVPVLRPRAVEKIKVETAARFDTQWKHWRGIHSYYERQFLDWVAPLDRADFAGKVVLEGGCGKGRHSAIVGGFGPRALIALDLGESAFVAFENTRSLPNVHVVIGDLLRPPVRKVFDLAFSVGVLHHLPDPALGFRSLAGRVRPGGRVAIWVYGLENNEWITRFVDPVREHVTCRLPPRALRAVAFLPSAALWAAINTIYRIPGRSERLPYAGYFASLTGFPFAEIHSIVCDQLVTPVAFYLPGDEVRRWFADGFRDVTLRWKGEYSWTGVATVSGTPSASAAQSTA